MNADLLNAAKEYMLNLPDVFDMSVWDTGKSADITGIVGRIVGASLEGYEDETLSEDVRLRDPVLKLADRPTNTR